MRKLMTAAKPAALAAVLAAAMLAPAPAMAGSAEGKLQVKVLGTGVLPDVPTISESGVSGFSAVPWVAMAAPAKVPRAIIEKLNTALNEVVQDPEVAARYTQLAMVVRPNSVAEADSFLRSETEKWGRVIREANIKLE